MITPKQFQDKFKKFSTGNSISALFILNDKIKNKKTTFTGELITINLIYNKYNDYCKWWNYKFGKIDSKYIAKQDRKMTLYDFLLSAGYNNTYEKINKISYLLNKLI